MSIQGLQFLAESGIPVASHATHPPLAQSTDDNVIIILFHKHLLPQLEGPESSG